MHGGFFGVEVFFVVSGYLITSLLLDEHERKKGSINLRQFWLRRARRLLPALAVMLADGRPPWRWRSAAPSSAASCGATSRGRSATSRNWGQIVGGVPYYAGDPPLLRHLWTLAIEEQFYVVWPLAFVLLARSLRTQRRHCRERLPASLRRRWCGRSGCRAAGRPSSTCSVGSIA